MSTKDSDQEYGKAKALYQQQRYAEALKVLDGADNGGNAHVLYTRVRCLTKLGRVEEARQHCERLRTVFKDARWKKLADKLDALEAKRSPRRADAGSAVTPPPAKHSRRKARMLIGAIMGLVVLLTGGGILAYSLLDVRPQPPVVDTAVVPEAEQSAGTQPPEPPRDEPKLETQPFTTPLALKGPSNSGRLRLRLPSLDASLAPPKDELAFDEVEKIDLSEVVGADRAQAGAGKLGLAMVIPGLASTDEKAADGPREVGPTLLASANNPSPLLSQVSANETFKFPTESLPFTPVGSVMGLQPFKSAHSIANARGDEVTLTNVNPYVGAWYILETNISGQKNALHLEVAALHGDPLKRPKLTVYRDGLIVNIDAQPPRPYPLWVNETQQTSAGAAAADTATLNPEPVCSEIVRPGHNFESPLTAICGGFVYIRSQKPGSATKLEVATDLLRETRLGDWLVEYAKPYLLAGPDIGEDHRASPSTVPRDGEVYPLDARVEEGQIDLYLTPASLGIATDAADNRYYYGRWYKALNHPHVFVSVMKPTLVEQRIMDSYKDRVGVIGSHDKDRRESDALVYLIAFDLSKFRFGYALGADHPRLDWSPRAWQAKKTGKGPDGFDSKSPFCTIGAAPPYFDPWVAASFAGGFKREHGAIAGGPLSKVNNGSHFGFMEQGVTFSRLLPGLATVAIARDGALDLFTWPEDGSGLLAQLAHARQNCISIVEGIDSNGISIPNVFVNDWNAGSWSGDQNGNLVTLRAGLAVQHAKGNRFLLFAYFTSATSNAMARVFQAYQCRYGMLLDMNTPNFCYAVLYKHGADGAVTDAECLHKDMASGNGSDGSLKFIRKNDTRDFFYVLRNY